MCTYPARHIFIKWNQGEAPPFRKATHCIDSSTQMANKLRIMLSLKDGDGILFDMDCRFNPWSQN